MGKYTCNTFIALVMEENKATFLVCLASPGSENVTILICACLFFTDFQDRMQLLVISTIVDESIISSSSTRPVVKILI